MHGEKLMHKLYQFERKEEDQYHKGRQDLYLIIFTVLQTTYIELTVSQNSFDFCNRSNLKFSLGKESL